VKSRIGRDGTSSASYGWLNATKLSAPGVRTFHFADFADNRLRLAKYCGCGFPKGAATASWKFGFHIAVIAEIQMRVNHRTVADRGARVFSKSDEQLTHER
jgi:hypothetical protein